MKTSDELYEKVNAFIDKLPYNREPKSLYEPIKYVLSLGGKRILAIDLYLRHASLSKLVDNPKQGLTSYLCGATEDIDSVILHNQFDGSVDILPVGVVPPNPTELLQSEVMGKLFENLKKEYDVILVDCPPIDIVADTNIVKKYADVSLFVVRV